MDLFDEIRPMVAKVLAVKETDVEPGVHLQDDLGADSLALLNLAEALNKQYGIDIQGDDMVELENVGALVELVSSRRA